MRKKETHKEEKEGKEGPTSFKDALPYCSLLPARNKNCGKTQIKDKIVRASIDVLSACSKRP